VRNVFLHSLIITLILQISWFFSFGWFFIRFFETDVVQAQSPWFPIHSVYRDSAGLENITATSQALSWDTQISENAEIPIDGGNTNFDLSVWGHYLVMYSIPVRSTWGSNRSEIQSWLEINGSITVPYSYGSSYIRRTDADFEWYNEAAAVIDVSPWDDISVNIQKTDSNTATMEKTPDRSGINILKLDDAWWYARVRPSISQAVTTSWADVDLWVSDELDVSDFGISWNDVTLNTAGKYLVTYSVGTVTTGTDRTNNEVRLTLDGTEIEATRSTAYVRAQNGSFTGIASYVGIIETSAANQILNLEIMRESTLQWTTNNTVAGKSGLTVTKLPDSADYIRMWEIWWWQDISTAATALSFDTTIEQGTNLQHDVWSNSEIDILNSGDYLLFHSIYNARTWTSNASRENPYLKWQIWWVDVNYGVSGSYNRHSNDGDGITNSSSSSAWVILPSLSPGDTIELIQQNEASNGESVYTAWRMWIQWVSLSSLFSGSAYLSQSSYRWRDDSSDFDTDTWWLAGESIDISNISKDDTIRLRMKVENPSINSYDSNTKFELQWAQTAWSCSSGLSWEWISTPWDSWEMVDTSHISPNAQVSVSEFLSNAGWNTHIQSEWYHNPDGETISTLAGVFTSNSQKEYEFSISASESALPNASYCFRLYNTQENKTLEVNNYAKLQLWSTPVILDDVWWEAGKVDSPIDGAWADITFSWGPYTSPIIVWRTNTYNDWNEALVFEARNVTSTWAQVRLCDSNAWNVTGCQAHAAETIWYIVVDASQTSSVTWIEAGTFSADQSFDNAGWLIVTNYWETFSQIPYVFTSVQTTNGNSPIVTRVSASTISNFTWGICQQNSQDWCNASHGTETYWWIAVDPSVNPFFKDMDIWTWVSTTPSNLWSTAGFSTTFDTIPVAISQTVTNAWGQDVQIDEIQNVTLSWMQFRACELDNDDDCDTHAIDTIRWLAIEEGVFADAYTLDKTHYRWYENNNSITPSIWLADENSTLLNVPASKELRLRMLLQNADPDLPASTLSLKLQYGSGASCDAISTWNDVEAPGGGGDFTHFDNPAVVDGDTLTSSLLLWWWHVLQSYSESLPTVVNPNAIPAGEWGEWDFSLLDNTWLTTMQYCFRVLTQNDDEIEYSSYAKIDTTDASIPTISSFTPSSWSLLPIWTFDIDYEFSDIWSWIDISNYNLYIQKWNGVAFGSDISDSYESLDHITTSEATFNISGLEYGRYQVSFEIYDNAGNSNYVIHEFYVDEIEFIISTPEIDVWDIALANTQYTSSDTLTVTVKTVGAAFDVTMLKQTDMNNLWENIPDWNGVTWFWYEENPYWVISSFWTWNIIASEPALINVDGDKNTYNYDIKYSVLLDVIENYWAWDYQSLLDFDINIDY
jgi:hypothetical protein